MQRARRLTSIAVIAALGATVLAGCRSEPGVAAYIGDVEITEDQVTALIDELRDAQPEPSDTPPEQAPGTAQPDSPQQPEAGPQLPPRADVVMVLVFNDLCERLSADRGYRPQRAVTAEQIAGELGVPEDAGWARERARFFTCYSGVPATEAVAPTEEELADLVEDGRAVGFVPPEASDAEARQQLDVEQLRSALGQRDMFVEAFDEYDVTVNPRYRPLRLPILSFPNGALAVGVPLGEGDPDTVVDAR